MKHHISLVVEPILGGGISAGCAQMLDLAIKLDIPVSSTMNGVHIFATPEMQLANIRRQYDDGLKRNASIAVPV